MPTTDTVRPTSTHALTYASYISFVPIGIATVLLGPMLPTLSARWSLNYAQAGALFTAQYLASTLAVGLSGVLAARWGFGFPMKAGITLMALGMAFLLSGPKLVGILCIAAYGTGLGLAVPAANLLVAAANPTDRSARLNLLNFFWSMGAVACPFLVATAAKSQKIPLLLLSVASLSLLIVIGIALMGSRLFEPTASRDRRGALLPFIRLRMRSFLILASLFFLYVGVENSFGQWMASYSKSLGTLSLQLSLATPSFFYASLMLGRWLAPIVLRVVSEIRMVQAGLLLACAGMAGLMFSSQLGGLFVSACAAGIGLSSVYPITIAFFSREFGSPRVGSLMFVLSNIGGGLLPWVVGVSSTQFGSLRVGMIVPLCGCAIMLACYLRDWSPNNSASLMNEPAG